MCLLAMAMVQKFYDYSIDEDSIAVNTITLYQECKPNGHGLSWVSQAYEFHGTGQCNT